MNTQEILIQILANQVLIYKKIETIENKMKNNSRTADEKTYVNEMIDKTKAIIAELKKMF